MYQILTNLRKKGIQRYLNEANELKQKLEDKIQSEETDSIQETLILSHLASTEAERADTSL